MDAASVVVSTTCIVASTPLAVAAVRAYRSYGGLRFVTCPETAEAAIVKIHAARAIASRLAGGHDLPLRSCSRWPERQGCGQECGAQLAAAPGGCRVPRQPGQSRALSTRPRVSQPATWTSETFVGATRQKR